MDYLRILSFEKSIAGQDELYAINRAITESLHDTLELPLSEKLPPKATKSSNFMTCNPIAGGGCKRTFGLHIICGIADNNGQQNPHIRYIAIMIACSFNNTYTIP